MAVNKFDEGTVEIRTVGEAVKLLDEWIAAYHELSRDYARLHMRMIHMQADLESWRFIAETEDNFRRALTGSSENSDRGVG